MKTFLSLVMVMFVSFAAVESAEAKRFGSGGFGKAFKTSPFKKSSPQKAVPSKNANGLAANGASRRPGMGGLMGGLLAGGMFAYLLGNGAFEGIQFMDILLFGLVGFVLFKLFAGKRATAANGPNSGYRREAHNGNNSGFESANTGAGNQAENPMDFPTEFDMTGFAKRGLDHYKLVHKAWDQGDMSIVKEYLHESLFEQLEAERALDDEQLNNEVLDLSADIVRSEIVENTHTVSILFRGRMKDLNANQEQGIYDVWHLQQTGNGSWLIIGIEAE